MEPKPSRRAGGAPTLSDVARAAQVSPMTVSRVINGDANVREQTREKVHAAVAALKYSPNPAARLLAGGAQCRIALIYGNPSSAYLSEVLVGCLAESGPAHVQLQLERLDESESATAVASRLKTARVNGVILPPPFSDDRPLIARLTKARIAVAILASGTPAAEAIAMSIDDAGAAWDMTHYLLEAGHRRIGFIMGDLDQSASVRRREGFLEALSHAGVTFDPELMMEGDFTYRSGLLAAERLLSLDRPPTAIFASNDDMAAAVVAAAHRRHLDVPADLSVCGFDDTALATTISPELTTVRQPIAEMARAAMQALVKASRLQRVNKPDPVEHRLFDHEIVRRESAASPLCRA